MGLIGARYIGGNNARGEYLAFIDAHVYVGPNWLKTPKRLIEEDPKTVVNYINFNPKWRQLRYHPHGSEADLGRRLTEGSLLADHHGHVCD